MLLKDTEPNQLVRSLFSQGFVMAQGILAAKAYNIPSLWDTRPMGKSHAEFEKLMDLLHSKILIQPKYDDCTESCLDLLAALSFLRSDGMDIEKAEGGEFYKLNFDRCDEVLKDYCYRKLDRMREALTEALFEMAKE